MAPEERDILAGEYALGLLEGEDLGRAERLAASDPEFRASVGRWAARLAPLADEVEPVAPPPELWGRIERSLATLPAAAPEVRPDRGDNVVDLRRKLVLWRSWAGAASAVAAALALFLLARPEPAPSPSPAMPMVAMLEAPGNETKLVATYDPGAGMLVVAPAVLTGAAGHEHQLWAIPAGGKPKAIGIIRPGKPMRMEVPGPMRPQMERITISVSVEPTGGSPTGAPTGPVIASGTFSRT